MICLGDMVGYFHQSLEVLDEIMRKDIKVLRGNHEAYLIHQLPYTKDKGDLIQIDQVSQRISTHQYDWIKSLPLSLEFQVEKIMINSFHGSPWSPLEGYIYPDYIDFDKFLSFKCQYMLLGHTHYPLLRKVGQLMVINPGSCGQPRDGDYRASAVILDTDLHHVEFLRLDYDVKSFLADARGKGVHEKVIQHLECSIKY